MPTFSTRRALTTSCIGVIASAVALAAPTTASAAPTAPNVEPQLVTSVDVGSGGTGARFLLGDVSGDGRLDLVTGSG